MNDTVARIVDLMFENVEMNEETAALRDEVMNNCQDRYRDLVAAGVPEDDAVAAVVESLRGMEDVIAQYSRKRPRTARPAETVAESRPPVEAPEAPVEEGDDLSGEQEVIYAGAAAEGVRRIDLTLVNEDVTVEPSDDDAYHVCWNADTDPLVQVALEGGVLRIERGAEHTPRNHVRVKGNGHRVEINMSDFEAEMNNFGSMMENFGRAMGRLFGAARNAFDGSDGVTIRVPGHLAPEIRMVTTSGDLEISGVACQEMSIVTTSGDITLNAPMDVRTRKVELRTTSGDVEVEANVDFLCAGSTSGDVDVEGRIGDLTVNTISGDIDVRADVETVNFKAISGDVDLAFDSDELRSVNGSTISGDIDVDLPSGLGFMNIRTQTRSGDVTTRCHTSGNGPAVNGAVSSMSGDITIR